MKVLKRCIICGKRMWPWQYLWNRPIHYKCAVDPLIDWLEDYLKR